MHVLNKKASLFFNQIKEHFMHKTRRPEIRKTPSAKKPQARKEPQKPMTRYILPKDDLAHSLLQNKRISSSASIRVHTKKQFEDRINELDKKTPIVIIHVYEGNPSVGKKPHCDYMRELSGKGFSKISILHIPSHAEKTKVLQDIAAAIFPEEKKMDKKRSMAA